MADNKTKPTKQSVAAFVRSIENDRKRADSKAVIKMMQDITGERPKMWGTSIIGFGTYHYKYDSGREGDSMLTGLSPRKEALTLYIVPGFGKFHSLMKKLGKYKTGKSCLYIKKLDDVDQTVLKQLISQSVAHVKKMYR